MKISKIADNIYMDNYNDFTKELFKAFDEKIAWYDTVELPRMLDEYRKLHSCVSNLYTTMLKKGVIIPDPYKHEKKISEINVISNKPFTENERSLVLGTRLSDYESMLDFICNYMTFTVTNVKEEKIRNLLDFNQTFLWDNVASSSASPNTRGLAESLLTLRQGSDSLAAGVINDSITNAEKATSIINGILKEFGDFQREVYKMEVRKDILEHPSFMDSSVLSSKEKMFIKIKKYFSDMAIKRPFYTELINEIIEETIGEKRDILRSKLFEKLVIHKTVKQKKEKEVDARSFLMDSVRMLSTTSVQIDKITQKLRDNSEVMENKTLSFFDKVCEFFEKIFNIEKKPLIYKIAIVEEMTHAKHFESINFTEYLVKLEKRSKFYNSFSVKGTPGYEKIDNMSDEKILEFITKQLSESQRLIITLNAFDSFFKENVADEFKGKIQGIKMEIGSIKNILVKTNQRKAEYSSLIEEQKQMKKLGLN